MHPFMIVAANRDERFQVAVFNEPVVELAHDAQPGETKLTDQRGRRTTDMRWLQCAQRQRHVRNEWRTENLATVAVDSRGKVDREHWRNVAHVRGIVGT